MESAKKPPQLSIERRQDLERSLMLGQTAGEVAEELGISVKTVRNNYTALYSELGVTSDHEAISLLVDQDKSYVEMVDRMIPKYDLSRIIDLTPQEYEVYKISVIFPRLTREELGSKLRRPILESTTKYYLTEINKKLGTKDRRGLILFDTSLRLNQVSFDEEEFMSYNPLGDQSGVTPQEIEIFRHSNDQAPSYQTQASQE